RRYDRPRAEPEGSNAKYALESGTGAGAGNADPEGPPAKTERPEGPTSGPSAVAASAASLIDRPVGKSVAAQATMMNVAMRFVSTPEPSATSTRTGARSRGPRPLSAM